MNFDEIKEKMNAENMEDAKIPKNISALNASEMPIEKVRKTMRNEIFILFVSFVVLFASPSFRPLYPLAEGIYYIMLFVTCLIALGQVVKMTWFLNKTRNMNLRSRDHLINYIFDLKMTLEVYKTASISGGVVLPFSVLSYVTGTKDFDESVFTNLILLNISTQTLFISILIYLVVAAIFCYVTILWVDKLYIIHIKKLEEILAEFEI